MARVRQKGTAPELIVREILKRQGHEFSINGKALPGSPDVFDPARKLALFVHGCFWHRHARCRACTMPKSNAGYWQEKFEQNLMRDRRKSRQLRYLGYRVITVWECQAGSPAKGARLARRLDRFFGGTVSRE
jgi:DNA mismatch endonuclease (patch repair protein)